MWLTWLFFSVCLYNTENGFAFCECFWVLISEASRVNFAFLGFVGVCCFLGFSCGFWFFGFFGFWCFPACLVKFGVYCL